MTSGDMTFLSKKFSSRLSIELRGSDFLILDPTCNRAYPFLYSSYESAHRVVSYISTHNESLWPCHSTGWLPPRDVTLRAI